MKTLCYNITVYYVLIENFSEISYKWLTYKITFKTPKGRI